MIVSHNIFPAESGAVLPGMDRAHITFKPFCLAVLKSMPPGFEARSIISAFLSITSREWSLMIVFGTVLNIRLHFGKTEGMLSV